MKKLATLFTFVALAVAGVFIFSPAQTARAYYGDSCSQYGIMAYEMGGYCKCMPGYVFGTDVLGDKTCVSGSSLCSSKYGYASRYDSLSESCKCNYGYSLHNQYGRTQCVSNDTICSDQIGYMSRYDSLSDSCECMSGYVLSGGQCKDGNSVCRAKHGLYSSYTSYDNKCSCDEGYTLDDSNQCVKKQNNVYFKLVDLDTDNRQAILKSDYDNRQYLITYGTGCFSTTFERYRYKRLIVNLGTDYDLDTWDTIVLQDDNQTCDITSRERTYEDTLETEEEEDYSYYYVPTTPVYTPISNKPAPVKSVAVVPATVSSSNFEVSAGDIKTISEKRTLISSAAFRKCPSTQCSIIRYYAEGSALNVTGQYSKGKWYRVDGTTDAGGTGSKITGWIHQDLFAPPIKQVSSAEDKSATSSDTQQKTTGFFNKLWNGFSGWFRR